MPDPIPDPRDVPLDLSGLRYCERCGSLLSDDNAACQTCAMIDAAEDLAPVDKESFLARKRKTSAKARARVKQELSGKTVGEFLQEREAEQRRAELPPPSIDLSLEVSALRPGRDPAPGYAVSFSGDGIDLALPSFRSSPHQLSSWATFQDVTVHGSDAPEQRATVPRAAAFGLFSLGFKKQRRHCFLTITSTDGTSSAFLVDGLMKHELEAHLAPVRAWLARNPPPGAQA